MHYTSREVYEYISQNTNDPIIEWKICTVSGAEYPIYQSDLVFYTKISPTFDGQKFSVPTPSLCPEERQRRRLSFRNERKLYKRRCDATGEQIISIYSPDKPYKVYNQQYRRSDSRDPIDYGFDFDFSKTFAQNFDNLIKLIPQLNLMVMNNENSAYTNYTLQSKNIYLSNDCMNCEGVCYSNIINDSRYCYDITDCNDCSYLYQCVDCENCYHGSNLIGCSDCENCYFCIGLKGKKNHIFNIPATVEEIHAAKFNSILNKERFLKFIGYRIQSSTDLQGSNKCIGNGLLYSSKSIFCFDSKNIQSCRYVSTGDNNNDCIDTNICNPNCSQSIELISGGEQISCGFNVACGYGSGVFYSYLCMNSSYIFGCIGLRNKQYCIFNKQYSKEEYEIQVAKIITHMQSSGERGEFFHPSLSPFGYNETVAQEYYPLMTDCHPEAQGNEAEGSMMVPSLCSEGQNINFADAGYHRSTYSSDPKIPEGVTTLTRDQVPVDIAKVTDDILKQVIICEISSRPYMIQRAELEFYRKHSISLPRKHPDIRHEERMKLRPERTLYLRKHCKTCPQNYPKIMNSY